MRTYLIYLLLVCAVLMARVGICADGKNPFELPAEIGSAVGKKEDVKKNIDSKKTIVIEKNGENLLNIDFVDAEISDVLRLLAKELQLNIVAGTDIKGKVTVNFNNVTLDDALASILRVNGYDYIKKDNIISVIKLGQPGVETESRVFTLKHVDAANVKASLITMISQYGVIETMVRKNGVGSEKTKDRSKTLIVTDVPGNLKKIEEVITQLDTPSAQVLIETKIVEVGLGRDKSLGIDWNVQAAVSGSKVPTTFPMPNKSYESRDSKTGFR